MRPNTEEKTKLSGTLVNCEPNSKRRTTYTSCSGKPTTRSKTSYILIALESVRTDCLENEAAHFVNLQQDEEEAGRPVCLRTLSRVEVTKLLFHVKTTHTETVFVCSYAVVYEGQIFRVRGISRPSSVQSCVLSLDYLIPLCTAPF